jgi:regulator of sigma E protease
VARDTRVFQSIMLLLVGGAIILLVRRVGLSGLGSIGLVALGLSLVIFIHELGHFLVAKWCDVHVETFSIGFGPAIPGCSFRWGETLYKIAWFPLGGYVKMVGEGAEDDDDDDPRSFKNKPVWQRMAIISAGVIMNVLLAFVCFIIAFAHGIKQQPAEVDLLDTDGAAWKAGLPTGAVISQIGNRTNPYFETLQYQVSLSDKGEKLKVVYYLPDRPEELHEIELEPREDQEVGYPRIGISPPHQLRLFEKGPDELKPAFPGTPAAHANPPFQPGDAIIATSDPDDPNKITDLPFDPRNTQRQEPSYFEFQRRLKELAGKPMIIRVRQRDGEVVDRAVPANYHWTFGARMRMGKITAVRDHSPAANAGVQEKDILKQVEITGEDGKRIRLVLEREPAPGSKPRGHGGTQVEYVDPLRLPYVLEQWARKQRRDRKVILTVSREVGHGPGDVRLVAEWDDTWQFNHDVPLKPESPQSIPELGLAYRVESFIEQVEPGSPAARGGLVTGDLIKAVRIPVPGKSLNDSEWVDLESDQWAYVFQALQVVETSEISIRIDRDNQEITLAMETDTSWPIAERGLILMPDNRIQIADNLWHAIELGLWRTSDSIGMIYLNLRSMLTGRIKPAKTAGGPILIAMVAYKFASEGIYPLILFLGMISINLAVINFLPIPVLDGGHMVFLILEKIKGSPVSETARIYATYVGLALILGLMVTVMFLDVSRLVSWFHKH